MHAMLAARDLGPYLIALGLMILVLMVATVGLLYFRSRVLGGRADSDHGAGLLQNLRAMRDRGEISIEEYDAARRAMVTRAAARNASAEMPLPAPTPPPRVKPAGGAAQTAAKGAESPGERRARPGYDLTGRPLPGFTPSAETPRGRPPAGDEA
jgi:hypothetical protein